MRQVYEPESQFTLANSPIQQLKGQKAQAPII